MLTKFRVIKQDAMQTIVQCACGTTFEYLQDKVCCPACGTMFPMSDKQVLAYERLAKAVVKQALVDLRTDKHPKRQAQARRWLLSEQAEFWCAAAGYDYNSIRDKLRKVL